MRLRRVGVVGIGAMGWPMAERLHEAGWAVTVHDIDPVRERLASGAGVAVAPDPQALAAACDAVIVAVVDAAQTREVLFGRDAGGPGDAGAAVAHRGIAGALAAGGVVLLCPTIAPEDVAERARDGTMSLMLAGEPAVLARAQPLLAALSERRFEVGRRPGDGARTKLVNNLLAAVNLAGAAEALALAERLGLDAATTLAVVEQSSGQSWIAGDRLRRHLAGDGTVRARIALLAKDSALALAAARAAGQAMPLGEQAAAAFARAVDAGLADADDAALFDLAAGRAPR